MPVKRIWMNLKEMDNFQFGELGKIDYLSVQIKFQRV